MGKWPLFFQLRSEHAETLKPPRVSVEDLGRPVDSNRLCQVSAEPASLSRMLLKRGDDWTEMCCVNLKAGLGRNASPKTSSVECPK